MKIHISIYILFSILSFLSCSKVDYQIDPAYEKAEITGVELYNKNANRADQKVVIQSESGNISVELKSGEDIMHLKLAVTASTGVTIKPAMSVGLQDLSQPKTYTVISPNGETSKQWTITVH